MSDKFGRDSPGHITMLSNFSRLLVKARRVELALSRAEELERLVANHKKPLPYHADLDAARLIRSLALANAGRLIQARQTLAGVDPARKTLRPGSMLDPNHIDGILLRLEGYPKRALARQQTAMSKMSDANEGYRNQMHVLTEIGLVYLDLGEAALAETHFGEALALFGDRQLVVTPRYADALVGLARVRLSDGRFAEALPLLQSAHAFWQLHDPDQPWALDASSWLARCERELDENSE